MTRTALASQLGPEFNDFLFAPIGDDRNGMVLSVLSALARLDLDPWQEAAKLAGLPGETAVRRLTSLIAALPDRSTAYPDSGRIASRLITLLPHRDRSASASRMSFLGVPKAINPWTVAYVVFMVLALGAQWVAASDQPPAQADKAHAPATSTVAPLRMPPPASDR
jgi:hypothetical protein